MGNTNLDILFDEAFENANLIPQDSVPQNLQLVLYGLYKQATALQQPTGIYSQQQNQNDLRNAFKLNAWIQVKHLSSEEAKQQYIDIINQLMKERNILK